MTDFKKLKVWQKAHAMALDVHRIAGEIRGTKHAISQVIEVRKMLHGLLRYLASHSEDQSDPVAEATTEA